MPIYTSGRTLHRCRTPKYKILGGDTKGGEGGECGGGLDELERAVYIALYLFFFNCRVLVRLVHPVSSGKSRGRGAILGEMN